MRNIYFPVGSVTPGIVTGLLNVKYVRLSTGCPNAALRREATKATAQSEIMTVLLSLTGLNMGASFLVKQRALGPMNLLTEIAAEQIAYLSGDRVSVFRRNS